MNNIIDASVIVNISARADELIRGTSYGIDEILNILYKEFPKYKKIVQWAIL